MRSLATSNRRQSPPVKSLDSANAEPTSAIVPNASQSDGWFSFLSSSGIQPKLSISTPGDAVEREADAVADRVMRTTAPGTSSGAEMQSRRQSSASVDRGATVVARKAEGRGTRPGSLMQSISTLGNLGAGTPLPASERAFFEPRLGRDLSHVRVHNSDASNRAARSIDARAFTAGSEIAFAKGEYSPGTYVGRHLIAHEVAHATAEPSSPNRSTVMRKEAAKVEADPLCASFVSTTTMSIAESLCDGLAAKADVEKRLQLVQALKAIRRCASDEDKGKIQSRMQSKLGETSATEIWDEAGTAFGGYRGVYPGYYSGQRLKNLGVKEVQGFKPFDYPEPEIIDSVFDPRAEKSAKAMATTIEATDILYFYGHQYAQYENPGAFANGNQDKFVDLSKLEGNGNFKRVKLVISTSCATICKEALDVFTKLFPDAVILGYRKSAPVEGEAVRQSFEKAILGLKRPMLLNEPVDVAAIIEAWKSVVEKAHPNESARLPGYYQGGTVHFLSKGKWDSLAGMSEDNKCKKKGTEIQQAR